MKHRKIKVAARLLVLLLISTTSTDIVLSQRRTPPELNERLSEMAKHGSSSRWLEVRKDRFITTNELLSEIRNSLELSEDNDLVLVQSSVDQFGFTRNIYQQKYQGIDVVGAIYNIRERGGRVEIGNGMIVSGLDRIIRNIDPFLTSHQAFNRIEQHLKKEGIDIKLPPASAADAELTIVNRYSVFSYAPEDWRLAYKFSIESQENMINEDVYIDALNGSILKQHTRIHSCTTSSGNTAYNGNRSFGTDYRAGTQDYRLRNSCVSSANGTVWTRDYNCPNSFAEVTNATTTWTTNSDAVGAHWAGEKTYEYFFNTHSRRSYNGASTGGGYSVNIYVDYEEYDASTQICMVQTTAFWNGSGIFLGGGNSGTTTDWSSIDVVGHEFTHGVNDYSANLVYEGESGALDESFSDIFGEMVEYYALGSNDWLIGRDFHTGNDYLRNMSDPHNRQDPDTYGSGDGNWINPNCASPNEGNDYCGVHTNSGVQNYWFYLLAMGGSGTNENNDSYDVTAIGRAKSAKIAYATLTGLSNNSEYVDARYESIHAAKELYGECSEEQLQCARAWSAVGVGTAIIEDRITEVCSTFSSGTHIFESAIIEAAGCSTSPTICLIESPAEVTFEANGRIILHPGFHSEGGSKFHAYIDELCTEILDKEVVYVEQAQDAEGKVSDNRFKLISCTPNPSSSHTTIEYRVVEPGMVSLILQDQQGKKVMVIVDQAIHEAGLSSKEVLTGPLPSGVYYIVLSLNGQLSSIEKMIVTH